MRWRCTRRASSRWGSSSRKSSAADSGEFDRRHDETIGGGWTEGPSTRNVGDACDRSQVSRRATVKNSVTQHGDLVLYALRYPQPTKADERISDCDRSASGGRSAVPPRSESTGVGARDRPISTLLSCCACAFAFVKCMSIKSICTTLCYMLLHSMSVACRPFVDQ